MGKAGEEQQPLPTNVNPVNTLRSGAGNRRFITRFVRFRCVFSLFLGVAVLLSVVFWLPPFFRHRDRRDLDLDSQFRDHYIVATFKVKAPVSVLEDNISQLRDEIFDEIGVATTKVEIIFLKSLPGSNITKVVFAFDPDVKGSKMSSEAKSLIKGNFVSLVIHQTILRLTTSLFGDPFSFDVLKFVGGITVIPQSAFPLQKVQIHFNFTLNFSIDDIQENFNELTSQLKSGLNLAPYENLYISLTNSKGSTIASPTTVQSSVVLAVGNTMSMGRVKQLAQTITGSPSKNLGLNNTEFGKVKQVSLSSILRHSLHGGYGTPSPSPAPLPHPNHRQHHHHHHHDHHHDVYLAPATSPSPSPATARGGSSTHHHHRHHHHRHHHHHHHGKLAPMIAPAPAPAATLGGGSTTTKGVPASIPVPAPMPAKSPKAKPPGCQYGRRSRFPRKHKDNHFIPPVPAPVPAQSISPSPQQHKHSPAPVPHLIPVSSPLPHVVYSHTNPPPKRMTDSEPPDLASPTSSSHSSSSAGVFPSHKWILPLLVLVLHV